MDLNMYSASIFREKGRNELKRCGSNPTIGANVTTIEKQPGALSRMSGVCQMKFGGSCQLAANQSSAHGL
jgi:hypothetical protein